MDMNDTAIPSIQKSIFSWEKFIDININILLELFL